MDGYKFNLLASLKPFVCIAIGAIIGSWVRLYLINFFGSTLNSKHWGTFIVNIFASFLLGFFMAFQSHAGAENFNINSPIFLLVNVGFLGTLSTFSTFISDLINTLMANRWKQFLLLSFSSLIVGILGAVAGLKLGNV